MNQQLPLRLRSQRHTSLDDFIGPAADRLQQLQNLVYLVGAGGSGKSHLLQGLCHRAIEDGGSALYLPMLASLEPTILTGLESADLVCLDDIDAVIADQAWHQPLFHLINACRDQGTKLVVSATLPVASLEIALSDLSSRLKAAYILTAGELSDEEKLEIVRLKAEKRGFTMDREVCAFILSRSRRDMHHLARLVEQLDEETLRLQKKVTIPFVKHALDL